MAVGDPLPALIQAAVADRPVWCLETPVAWPALTPWLAEPRLTGVVWMLGERPARRQIGQLWPEQQPEGAFFARARPWPGTRRRRPGCRVSRATIRRWRSEWTTPNQSLNSKENRVRLVWFRNDLRCHGHTPLTQALAGGDAVTALHILCPDQWDAHGVAPARRWFVLHSLLELGESLAARGVDLHVLDGGDFDGSVTALENFVAEQGVTEVFCNREYPLNELNRDGRWRATWKRRACASTVSTTACWCRRGRCTPARARPIPSLPPIRSAGTFG